MIYGAELLGKKLSQTNLAKEFRRSYKHLSNKNDKILQNFFLYNDTVQLQFDGFLMIYSNLCSERPDFIKENSDFDDFVKEKCARFSVIQKIIIHHLNILEIDDCVHNIVDNPFDHGTIADKQKQGIFKESLDQIIKEDSDEIFQMIMSLKDKFFDSDLFKNYLNALDTDKNLEKYEIDIQSLFYIIKQIIYQNIKDGQIKEINEDHIIKFNHSSAINGDFFDIKYQPSQMNLKIKTSEIVRIVYDKNIYNGFITLTTLKFSKEKGFIIRIKGEILKEDGINVKSQNNLVIDEHLKNYY